MEPNTGVQYPEVTLGGKTYQIKFTRGMIYRMDKAGIVFSPKFLKDSKQVQMSFSNLVDVLGMAINFTGTSEELAELAYDQRNEITTMLVDAWGNLVLSSKAPVAAAQSEAIAPQQPLQ